ncbi:DUF6452 family protein [Chitinophaga sancti]|uniref:DUF6452 family protein n=1 Tax=Chitinophaga sancti TaxID=1004 RepID=A0A1K1SDC2_9BACT|nr:DUF6452 family protein [Chitinophaga sancti]WQD59936.1 DUF6452 family protein [Chitinophaga sancti]WQG87934.1 DUF6452 family protein [Chitinophaga sancti]SFW82392.1 hypothetical protein SAMN05661012_05221 [Chitinophaga sancti]
MKYFSGIIALLLLVVFAACEDETKTCDQTLLANLGINFKKDSLNGFINKDTIWPKVSLCALGKDTLIRREARSSIYFALDPQHDTCRFFLKLDSAAVADTLTFRYTRTPHFISPGCGFTTFSTLDTVICTYHTINALHINNREVTSGNIQNITLYFIY